MHSSTVLCCALLTCNLLCVQCEPQNVEEGDAYREKRIAGSIASIIAGTISAGASLVGTTVSALMDRSFNVAVSGSVENYTKWPLVLRECELYNGYMNVPVRTVYQGEREAFASHKIGHTATGSMVKCSFYVDGDTLVHFMYSAPYNFNFYSNYLALAVCSKSDAKCRDGLKFYDMYYYDYMYLVRKEYYNSVEPMKICNSKICVYGVMGTSHHPTLTLKVRPRNYEDLAFKAKDTLESSKWTKEDYKRYMETVVY